MAGWTVACLKQDGTVPVVRELLKIINKLGPTASNDCFRSLVGIMSSWQLVGFILFIRPSWGRETGLKLLKEGGSLIAGEMSWGGKYFN